jgi:hypothetical protein
MPFHCRDEVDNFMRTKAVSYENDIKQEDILVWVKCRLFTLKQTVPLFTLFTEFTEFTTPAEVRSCGSREASAEPRTRKLQSFTLSGIFQTSGPFFFQDYLTTFSYSIETTQHRIQDFFVSTAGDTGELYAMARRDILLVTTAWGM